MNENTSAKSAIFPILASIGLVFIAGVAIWFTLRGAGRPPAISDEFLTQMRPLVKPHSGFIGSAACRECHQDKHESWHHSYHRTMTLEGTVENFLGKLNVTNITFPNTDDSFTVFERNGRPWVRSERVLFPDNPLMQNRHEYPIVMMTGSHHEQSYWVPTGDNRTLAQLPIVHCLELDRWIPRTAGFLAPESTDYDVRSAWWNSNCLECHSTAPLPNRDPQGYGTQVAELGISCESCHGPGADHATIQRNPDSPDVVGLLDKIVDPANMDHKVSTEICGACHSARHAKHARVARPYNPVGTPWSNTFEHGEARPDEPPANPDPDAPPKELSFWPDGSIRITGREFSGLRKSACHTKGEMSCLTCHAVHQSPSDKRPAKEWANDQLDPDAMGNASCVDCHENQKYGSSSHTHHIANSSGSQCLNCHMPHSNYGLLKAVRSHTIWSPRATETIESGRPTACNLCHLDQTLEWTAKHLHEWYGHEIPEMTTNQKTVSTAAEMALSGDAGQRAMLVWNMAWEPAVQTSAGTNWIPAYLSRLVRDPYPAIRIMARRSIRKFPGYETFDYDPIGTKDSLLSASEKAFSIWQDGKRPTIPSSAILLGENGELDREKFESLYHRRNDRRIVLAE